MKRGILIGMIGLVLCLLCYLPGHGQWTVIKSFPYDMYDIQFLSSDIGYVCGGTNDGILMMTEDGGESWTTLITSATDIFRAAHFLSIEIGLLSTSGLGDRIFRTVDEGASWTEVYTGSSPMYDICFVNNSTGYIAPSVQNNHTIMKSYDAGASWNNVGSFTTTQSGSGVMDIDFPDGNTGYLGLDAGYIYKTASGGTNWIEKYSSDIFSIRALQFFTNETGYAAGLNSEGCPGINCGVLLHTTNGGEIWDTQFFDGEIYEVTFTDQNTGYIGSFGILKTTDAGQSWQMESGTALGEVTKIDFPESETGYALARLPGQAWLLKREPIPGIQQSIKVTRPTLSLFPNPVNDLLTISGSFPKGSTIHVEFLDVAGRCVVSLEIIDTFHGHFRKTVSVEMFSEGVYLVRAVSENQEVTKPIFIL